MNGQLPTRGFIDGMAMMTYTIQQGRWMLNVLAEIFALARTKVKPTKSRNLVIKNRKLQRIVF